MKEKDWLAGTTASAEAAPAFFDDAADEAVGVSASIIVATLTYSCHGIVCSPVMWSEYRIDGRSIMYRWKGLDCTRYYKCTINLLLLLESSLQMSSPWLSTLQTDACVAKKMLILLLFSEYCCCCCHCPQHKLRMPQHCMSCSKTHFIATLEVSQASKALSTVARELAHGEYMHHDWHMMIEVVSGC